MTKMIAGAALMAAATPLVHAQPREFGRKDGNGGGDPPSLEQLQRNLDAALNEVKGFATEFRTKNAEGTKVSDDAKEKADKALVDLEAVRSDIKELSQKLAQGRRGGGDDEPQLKSLGVEVANHPDVKDYIEGGDMLALLQAKARRFLRENAR